MKCAFIGEVVTFHIAKLGKNLHVTESRGLVPHSTCTTKHFKCSAGSEWFFWAYSPERALHVNDLERRQQRRGSNYQLGICCGRHRCSCIWSSSSLACRPDSLCGTWRRSSSESLTADIPETHRGEGTAADWISLIRCDHLLMRHIMGSPLSLCLALMFSGTLGVDSVRLWTGKQSLIFGKWATEKRLWGFNGIELVN